MRQRVAFARTLLPGKPRSRAGGVATRIKGHFGGRTIDLDCPVGLAWRQAANQHCLPARSPDHAHGLVVEPEIIQHGRPGVPFGLWHRAFRLFPPLLHRVKDKDGIFKALTVPATK